MQLKSGNPSLSAWKIGVPKIIPALAVKQIDDRHFILDADSLDLTNLNDAFVKFNYRGDRALCFLNGELQTDNLCIGEPWLIGLKRYAKQLQSHDIYF